MCVCTDAGNTLVAFPEKFDTVVGMMTRHDLRQASSGKQVPWAKYLLDSLDSGTPSPPVESVRTIVAVVCLSSSL